ncbi:glycoside hydrolase domain-containing protein [Olivibacter sp. XZL3]|uniref:glycoside hydrolase domain-containing protein n=1 Tax=Olivibacter sp. XZL3 TaxID=1735116 RepID=UPI001066FB7F|nr:glycoside hydrolase domain-containing protein [Olivibacter sp. XZL3]
MYTKTKLLYIIMVLLSFSVYAQHHYPPQKSLWGADSLGNQRAVIRVKGDEKLVKVSIPWRNRNVKSDQRVIIVDSLTQQAIDPARYVTMNEEGGVLLFHPLSGEGIYYVYYLPYQLGGRSKYYPDAEYLKKADTIRYEEQEKQQKPKSKTQLLRLESVDAFNENGVMETIATQEEVNGFICKHKSQAYFIFPEDRSLPIRMNDHVPKKWLSGRLQNNRFEGESARGCFYAFQLGLWSPKQALENVRIIFSPLRNEKGATIGAELFNCINTRGVSYTGEPIKWEVNVPQDRVQPLWCGVKLPEEIEPGTYEGVLTVKPANAPEQQVQLKLVLSAEVATDGGVHEPWLQTRLPWLNSTLAQENTVIKPYIPLQVMGDTAVSLLGRKVIIAENGLPKQIQTFFSPAMTHITDKPNDLLYEPIHFHFEQADKKEVSFKTTGFSFLQKEAGTVSWQSSSMADGLQMDITASLEFDGFLNYTVKVTALHDMALTDIAMHIPYQQEQATYLMGLGYKGGRRPEAVAWKWDVANKNQDGAWIGAVNAGMQFSLRDEHYSRPLNTNFYLQKPLLLPTSWGNANRGGIDIGVKGASMLVNSYSGARNMKKGDTLFYNFNLLITPFHALNTEEQWSERYFHAYKSVDTVKASGANVINIHHGNALNPYINYPFIATKEMKSYIDSAHHLGLKVKIYNTVREVSNRMYELYPLRSLGHEVFSSGPGKGYSWLQEHLQQDYIAAWFVPFYQDAAIINSGMNRWHNYYVEGMNWLVDRIGIDGIYLDDVAFDRVTMKRIKRVMTKDGRPGLIDLHSANQYNERDGFNNSANLYLEHFPYLNRLWFGEYFDYENNDPDFFLTEVSGIPFGLMGEMLQDGGNPWRGMVYGMTNRLPYQKSGPQALWKAWDDFGMKGSEMIGYWVADNPVKVDRQDVLATGYQKKGKLMISLASWATEDVAIQLQLDWQKLGIDPQRATITAPAIDEFQTARHFKIGEAIPVQKNKGLLLIVE